MRPGWLRALEEILQLHVDQPGRLRARTLALIRWIGIAGQLTTIVVVHEGLGFDLPLMPLLATIAVSALVNLPLTRGAHKTARLPERTAALVLAFDILQLSLLLGLTGGLRNPFALIMLTPVTLSATSLSLGATITLGVLTINAVTALALVPTELPWGAGPPVVFPKLYLFAVWCALVVGIIMLSAYSWRVTEEARRMAAALAATQMALAREQHLSAVGALAAAAAHELGSPLATIAVTAREIAKSVDEPWLREEAELVVEQTQRCRSILATLSSGRHSRDHERYTAMPITDALASLIELHSHSPVRIHLALDGTGPEPVLPLVPEVRHALNNLLDNAVQFARGRVDVVVTLSEGDVVVSLADDGPGFNPDILESLGEPYVSSRHGKGGHGLGVFIADALLSRTGARLSFANREQGAQVTIRWRQADLAALGR